MTNTFNRSVRFWVVIHVCIVRLSINMCIYIYTSVTVRKRHTFKLSNESLLHWSLLNSDNTSWDVIVLWYLFPLSLRLINIPVFGSLVFFRSTFVGRLLFGTRSLFCSTSLSGCRLSSKAILFSRISARFDC